MIAQFNHELPVSSLSEASFTDNPAVLSTITKMLAEF